LRGLCRKTSLAGNGRGAAAALGKGLYAAAGGGVSGAGHCTPSSHNASSPSSAQPSPISAKSFTSPFITRRRIRSTSSVSGGGTPIHTAASVHCPSGTSTCRCGVNCSAEPKYCRNPTPPPCSFPFIPSRFGHRRCHAHTARTSRRSIRASKAGCFTSAHLARNGADSVHCRYASCGSNSPHSAAVSCERLVPHDGHSPRCLQLKATSSVRRHRAERRKIEEVRKARAAHDAAAGTADLQALEARQEAQAERLAELELACPPAWRGRRWPGGSSRRWPWETR
jgi:hypothetical protein